MSLPTSDSDKSLNIAPELPCDVEDWDASDVSIFLLANRNRQNQPTDDDIQKIVDHNLSGPAFLKISAERLYNLVKINTGNALIIEDLARKLQGLDMAKKITKLEHVQPGSDMETHGIKRRKITLTDAEIRQYWEANWGKDLPDNAVQLPETGERDTGDTSAGIDRAIIGAEGEDAVTVEAIAEIDSNQADLLPGPPYLSGSIFLGLHRYLVRAEYLRIYNFLKQISDEYTEESQTLPPVAVITGQPGIGKTFFIRYGLIRCLSAKQHVVYCTSGMWLYFSSTGVRRVEEIERTDLLTERHCDVLWIFIDSAQAPDGLPLNMIGEFNRRIFVIYITSPKISRWNHLQQMKEMHLIIMNPWSWEEIDAVRGNLYPAADSQVIRRRFDDIGPTARICFNYSDTAIGKFLEARQAVIVKMAPDLTKIASAAMNGEKQEGEHGLQLGDSHKICLVWRAERHDVCSSTVVQFISTQVEQLVATQLLVLSEEALVQLWFSLNPFPNAHGMTGVVFEVYCHRHLRKIMLLDAEPMFKFKSFHALFSDLSSNPKLLAAQKRAGANARTLPLNFRPLGSLVYEGGAALQENTYCQPRTPNEPALDSFIIHDNILYILQITCGATHKINKKLLETLEKHQGLPNRSTWRLIFVVPATLKAFSCPDPEDTIQFITSNLYTARVTVGSSNTV